MGTTLVSHLGTKEAVLLQSLGLTQNQARVYLALAKFDSPANAKTISNTTGLAACDIYRVVPELQKLGLLEVLVTSPKEFQATPPQDAMEILYKRRETEMKDIQKRAKQFVAETQRKKNSEPPLSKMSLIPCGHRAIQFGMPKLLGTKEKVYAVQTNKLFRRFASNTSDDLKRLLDRVRMRFIIESEQGIESPDDGLAAILENPNFEVRFAKDKIQACILLHDDTDAFISTSLDTTNTPSYWSNNTCIIAVVQSYFDETWRKSYGVQNLKHRILGKEKP